MTPNPQIPDPEIGIQPPGALAPWREVLTPVEWFRLARGWRGLPKSMASEPKTAVLVPGFGASPLSMGFIRQALRRRGHRTFDWGLGRNTGEVAEVLPKVVERIEAVAERADGPVVAIGWSLGGYLAREAARDRPDLVSRVITLGSPVIGGPTYTTVAPVFKARGYDLAEIRQLVSERFEVPLKVPVLAIYSKRDGIVAWQACIDEWSPDVRHLEVGATHLSLGTSPDVLAAILEELD